MPKVGEVPSQLERFLSFLFASWVSQKRTIWKPFRVILKFTYYSPTAFPITLKKEY